MKTEDLNKEAQTLYHIFLPIRQFIAQMNPKAAEQFQNILVLDLARVGLIAANIDRKVNELELYTLKTFVGSVLYGPQEAFNILNQWGKLTKEVKDQVTAKFDEIFKRVRETGLQELVTPTLLQELDERQGTSFSKSVSSALYRFAQVMIRCDDRVLSEERGSLKLLWGLLTKTREDISEMVDTGKKGSLNKDDLLTDAMVVSNSIDEVMKDVNFLVGQSALKKEIGNIVSILKAGAYVGGSSQMILHAVFCGNPGSGKKFAAGLIGRLYQSCGALTNGNVNEWDAISVKGKQDFAKSWLEKQIEKSEGGILYVSHADILLSDAAYEPFVEMITHAARPGLAVILAGATETLESRIQLHGKLNELFKRFIKFENYTDAELILIFKKLVERGSYELSHDAEKMLPGIIEEARKSRQNADDFINAFYRKVTAKQAARVTEMQTVDETTLKLMTSEDLKE